MSNHINDIAKLIVENMEPGQPAMNIPQTPSQVLMHVFQMDGDPKIYIDYETPLEINVQKITDYAKNIGLAPDLVKRTVQFIRQAYEDYEKGEANAREAFLREISLDGKGLTDDEAYGRDAGDGSLEREGIPPFRT